MLTVVCFLFRKPIIFLFGASDASYVYADEYLKIYLFGTLFPMLVIGMNGFINAQGFPKFGMVTTILGAVINIVLDPVFDGKKGNSASAKKMLTPFGKTGSFQSS